MLFEILAISGAIRAAVRGVLRSMQSPRAESSGQLRRDLEVALLGSRTVGKTSMVAAMYSEFERVCRSPTLQLIPEEQTGVVLANLLVDLKRAAAGEAGLFDPLETGIQRTEEPEEYKLHLVCTSEEYPAALHVTFHDYPGGWLSEKTAAWQEHIGHVNDVIAGSAVLLVTLDAPSVMVLNDADHEQINRPTALSNFLKRALLKPPAADPSDLHRLVVFIPMRGEKWLQDGNAYTLWQRFQERFEASLRVIKGYPETVAAVYCPVQTLGTVRFDHYRGQRAIFQRLGTGYRPVDCDQPLRYSLAFALNALRRHAESKREATATTLANRSPADRTWFAVLEKVFDVPDLDRIDLRRWEERATALLRAVEEFAAGCNKDGPSVVIQNPALFSL